MKKKIILSFIIGFICALSISVCAVYLYTASSISFTPSNEEWQVNNIESAVNDLYGIYNEINTNNNVTFKNNINSIYSNISNYYANYPASGLSYTYGATYANGVITLTTGGGTQFGPYATIDTGCYFVVVHGTNLDNVGLNFSPCYNYGTVYTLLSLSQGENYASYFINVTTSADNEFRTMNYSSTEVSTVTGITLYKVSSCPSK